MWPWGVSMTLEGKREFSSKCYIICAGSPHGLGSYIDIPWGLSFSKCLGCHLKSHGHLYSWITYVWFVLWLHLRVNEERRLAYPWVTSLQVWAGPLLTERRSQLMNTSGWKTGRGCNPSAKAEEHSKKECPPNLSQDTSEQINTSSFCSKAIWILHSSWQYCNIPKSLLLSSAFLPPRKLNEGYLKCLKYQFRAQAPSGSNERVETEVLMHQINAAPRCWHVTSSSPSAFAFPTRGFRQWGRCCLGAGSCCCANNTFAVAGAEWEVVKVQNVVTKKDTRPFLHLNRPISLLSFWQLSTVLLKMILDFLFYSVFSSISGPFSAYPLLLSVFLALFFLDYA